MDTKQTVNEEKIGFPECTIAELEKCMNSFQRMREAIRPEIAFVEKMAEHLEYITRSKKGNEFNAERFQLAVKESLKLLNISKLALMASNAQLSSLNLLGIVEKACKQEIKSRERK